MLKPLLLFLLCVGLLICAKPSYGQVPPLGAVASYALFTKTGAVSNVGSMTVVTGDVGTNVGALTGYNNVVGQKHVADDATVRAAGAVVEAYDYLVALPRGSSIGPVMGNGLVLTSGIYSLAAASSLVGNLYLDGQNNPNAYFIFKIGGAFSVGAGSNVVLRNLASSANVFYQVYGAVSIAANTAFVGTIVADGAIELSDGVSLDGRALSIAGAISTYNNQITRPAIGASAPLPMVLTTFSVAQQDDRAQLRWTTALEKNNAYFAVESSTDGKVFDEIGHVTGHGSSNQAQAYEWSDANLARYAVERIYYRLRQVDADGSAVYSTLRTVVRSLADGLRLQAYPNPTQHQLGVLIDVRQAGPATLQLIDNSGHVVMQRNFLLAAGANPLVLDEANELRSGLYMVLLQQGTQRQLLRLVR